MRFLLDTNIISDVIDCPKGTAATKLRHELRSSIILTSIIVVAELRYGYTKIRSNRLRQAYEQFFASIKVEEWQSPFDHAYAEIRDQLEKKGRPIGAMDMLIASHAKATDAIVVTANEKHFSQVPGLKIENWVR